VALTKAGLFSRNKTIFAAVRRVSCAPITLQMRCWLGLCPDPTGELTALLKLWLDFRGSLGGIEKEGQRG